MTLPPNLITGKTARLPGDRRQHPQAIGRRRHLPGAMNKREAAYAAELELRKKAEEILWYGFECVTLKLADKPEGTTLRAVRYTPDFAVLLADGTIEFHEVKGFVEDDAAVKFKAAAEKFWMFHFVWKGKEA